MIGAVHTPAIRLQGVTKRYDKKTAVRDLDLEVPTGSIYGLIGPNGAGKTTTLRMILDIIGADTGSVEMFGSSNIEEMRPRVGYLPEERGLYQKMTAVDHLAFFGQLKGIRRKEALARARAGLEAVGLGDRADDKVETFSKGMAQKTQFLAVILHEPDLLVLDEPFSGLDPLNVELFKEMILERRRAGATILLSTHLIEDAERLCERVCMIAGATKVLDGRLRDIKAAAGRQAVAISFEGNPEFLGAPHLIERIASHGRYVEVRMHEGADPQELLRLAVRSGALISRFELIEPSLREIFIEKATEAGLSHQDESEGDEAAA
ncbi:ABC transporter ATP-binding protein [Candidatus Palauibacter sp.]|uniref:ABC transporter ATP-binding protein n=1 Tax=Candidatus Palauibacter sp. TaxID=3101350 RepID=UPI003B58E8CD